MEREVVVPRVREVWGEAEKDREGGEVRQREDGK